MATTQWNVFGQTVQELDAAAAAQAIGPLTPEDKFQIITRHLQEHTKDEITRKILQDRDLRIYWGTAPTGKPHLAYFVPMAKISDFLRAGCEVTILLADLHAYLDSMKAPWELLGKRTEYYKECICGMLESIGVPIDKLKFVVGSSFQLSSNYQLDTMKLCTLCSQHDAQKAGAEVVKQSESPPLSGLVYPLMQWLDEEYLKCDAQFGGVDQRKIFISAEKYLPKINYAQRAHFMNKMVPGLTGDKMSASDPNSKIDLMDSPKAVQNKIKKVFCEQGNVEKNPLLEWVKSVFLIIRSEFVVERKDESPLVFTDAEEVERAFAAGEIHPADFKAAAVKIINELLEPIRKRFDRPELKKLVSEAYPEPGKADKKAKKGDQGSKAGKSASSSAADRGICSSRLDMRVGKITKVEHHPDADSLFVETIELGDASGPRTVISGLVGRVAQEDLQDRMVVCLCNLRPTKMRGIESAAMVLCATAEDGACEPIAPPEGSKAGDRVVVEGAPNDEPDAVLRSKHKVWETLQPKLVVDSDNVCKLDGAILRTQAGQVTTKAVKNAPIK